MKKIFICVNQLKDIGGIGTAAINLINEIHEMYEITLCLPSNFISPKYNIPNNVRVVRGSNYLRDVIVDRKELADQSLYQKILRNIRRVLNHYVLKTKGIEHALSLIKIDGIFDVAIAFGDFRYSYKDCKCFDYEIVLNNVVAKRKIAWIHNEPINHGWTNKLAKDRLSKFDAIVNVSFDCKRIFDSIIPEFENKSFVVYNMYNIENIKQKAITDDRLYEDNKKIHFVTVARIQRKQKRIDRIINVCKRLKDEGKINFDWTLVGYSPELIFLEQEVINLGLNNIIRFVGLQTNPYPYMQQADAFVLSSEFEGFGMVLRESQILGTPTFTTNFGASEEAILNKKQGEVCFNSEEGLYNMISSILSEPNVIHKYRTYLRDNPISNSLAIKQFKHICEEK